jgi:hypothetical protein
MQASRFHSIVARSGAASTHQRQVIVTSSYHARWYQTATAISTPRRSMATTSLPINRITQLNNHITTLPKQRANMSSQTNNDQFKLENLFNVKVRSFVLLSFDQC